MIKTKKTVDVSDAKISKNPKDMLVTYSLGSCIAVCLYDPSIKLGGMLHFQLPESRDNPQRAQQNPFMYADTGMQRLVKKMLSLGANKKRMQVKLAGGAKMANGPLGFDIGKRNHTALRKILWKNGMFIDAQEVGGTAPRNMYLDLDDGTCIVKTNGIEKKI